MRDAAARISVHKLGLGNYTRDGAFYARVDGQNIGVDGRCFWHLKQDAQAAAEVWINQDGAAP